MSMSDPISDYLTRIRNGLMAKKRWVDIPSSMIKKRISFVLKEESYIDDFLFISQDKKKSMIRLFLKYDYQGHPVIENIKIWKKISLSNIHNDQITNILETLKLSSYIEKLTSSLSLGEIRKLELLRYSSVI